MTVFANPTILDDIEILTPISHNSPSAGLFQVPLPPTLGDPLTKAETEAAAAIPTRCVELALTEVRILDNFEGLFGGTNEIKLVSLVFDGNSAEPFHFQVSTFTGIKKDQPLPIGDRGIALYFSEPRNLPRFLDWRLLVIEDDSDVRNAGRVIKEIQATNEYKAIVNSVIGLVAPTWGVITQITSGVISLVARVMEQNKDDVISLFAATYTLAFDELGKGSHTLHQDGRSRIAYEIRI